jgi:class 3 adenylate cyclase
MWSFRQGIRDVPTVPEVIAGALAETSMAEQNTLESLVRENETLRARLGELEQSLSVRAVRPAPATKPETILGLDVMILLVNAEGQVRYMNSAMSRLLAQKREEVVGEPLEAIDRFHWGPGLLTMMYEQAKEDDRTQEAEAKYYDQATRQMKYVTIRGTPSEGGIQFVIEDRSHFKQLEGIFSRYVSPRVIEQMMATGKDYLQAEQLDLTLLFSDLRGFTAAARNLEPGAVKQLIDTHLAAVIDVITGEDGTVDKIMGDGIMAFFGAPVRQPDHPVRALNAALKMQRVHQQVMELWTARGLPALPMGIGINTGTVVVGNIGCDQRMEYTALGHEVNLASRLCQAAAGGEIILSTQTFQAVRDLLTCGNARLDFPVKFRNGFKVNAKGIDEPVPTVVAVQLP